MALGMRQVRHHPRGVVSFGSGQRENPAQGAKNANVPSHAIKNVIPALRSFPSRASQSKTSHLSSRICHLDKAPTDVSTCSRGGGGQGGLLIGKNWTGKMGSAYKAVTFKMKAYKKKSCLYYSNGWETKYLLN